MLQFFTEAVKQTYIDKWLDREKESLDFMYGLQRAIDGTNPEYAWFLT
jgi:hypothetical protein